MKKLISTALAVTMLTVPLISSSCFAHEVKKTGTQCIQSEEPSNPSQMQNTDLKKSGEILACGTAALTDVTAAALKLAEDKLPENIKSKLPFLYNKKSQESQENIEKEKTSETVSEPVNSKIIQSLVKNNTSIANKTNLTAANFTSNNANSFNKLEKSSGNLFNLKEKIPSTEKSLLWSVLFLLLIIQTIVIEPLANKISTAREEILNEYF